MALTQKLCGIRLINLRAGLAGELIDRLPSGATLIADRNFGIFAVLWRAHRQGHRVLTRLTSDRAKRLAGGAVPEVGSDLDVVWEPSGHDRRAHPEIAAGARVEGRLMAIKPEGAKQILYLFTTREEPADQVAALYGRRWTIWLDLRSLFEQVRLSKRRIAEATSPGHGGGELLPCRGCLYGIVRFARSCRRRRSRQAWNRADSAFHEPEPPCWPSPTPVCNTVPPNSGTGAGNWCCTPLLIADSRNANAPTHLASSGPPTRTSPVARSQSMLENLRGIRLSTGALLWRNPSCSPFDGLLTRTWSFQRGSIPKRRSSSS